MKNYTIFIVLTALVLLFKKPYELQAQPVPKHDISGYVYDAATGKPLQAANVFLANTMFGDATDEKGYFLIRNVPRGTFEIVVSFIGYEVKKREIRITGPTKPVTFKLTPKTLQAPEIEVIGKDMKEWREKLEKFKALFFSTTRNASECEIFDPYVLDFAEVDGAFKAMAEEPIVIKNRALGYKLFYVLEEFEDTPDFLKIRGIPKFEELTPETPQEVKKWQANRLRAYRGSLRHFLATICKNYDAPIVDDKRQKAIRAINEKNLLRTTRAKTIESTPTLEERDYLYKMARVIYEGFNVLQFDENPSRYVNREIEGSDSKQSNLPPFFHFLT